MNEHELDAMKAAAKRARGIWGEYVGMVRRLPRDGKHIYQVGKLRAVPIWTQLGPGLRRVDGVEVLGEGASWDEAFKAVK
jgi:hypothetical protein